MFVAVADFLASFGPLFTGLGVVLGWIVVHRFSRARDEEKMLLDLTRDAAKERREAAREVLKQLRDLEEKAIAFHLGSAFDERKANELMRLFDRVADELAMWRDAPMPYLVVQLRQSISLHNFEEEDFRQQSPNSDVVRNIGRNISAISRQLLPQSRLWKAPTSMDEIRKLK